MTMCKVQYFRSFLLYCYKFNVITLSDKSKTEIVSLAENLGQLHTKYSSTSSTDKYVLKYKYQVQVLYLTPTQMWL